MCKYHQQILGHITIDNKVVPKPLKTQLNKDNIGSVQEALVQAYQELDLSSGNSNPLLYKPFKKDDAPICIYTDGIQKFSKKVK